VIQIQKIAGSRVSAVGHQGHLDVELDVDAFLLEGHQFRAGLAGQLGPQLVADFDDGVTQRRNTVVDLERTQEQVAPQSDVIAGARDLQVGVGAAAFDPRISSCTGSSRCAGR
jgi:hypothetical protein